MAKGIMINVGMEAGIREFGEPLFRTVGRAVGGLIEVVRPMKLPKPYVMIVNDSGLRFGLPRNEIGCLLYGTDIHGSPIVGNIVIMKEIETEGCGDIAGLDDKDIETLWRLLQEGFGLEGGK